MPSTKRNNIRIRAPRRSAKSSIRTQTYTFTVLFEQDEDGFIVASVPALPGCFTQGRTHQGSDHRLPRITP
jgi:hypothetical protein